MFDLTGIDVIDGKWSSGANFDRMAIKLAGSREEGARLWSQNSNGTVLATAGSDGTRWVGVFWTHNDATRTNQFRVTQDCDSGDDIGWFADFDAAMIAATAALRG